MFGKSGWAALRPATSALRPDSPAQGQLMRHEQQRLQTDGIRKLLGAQAALSLTLLLVTLNIRLSG